MNKNRLSPSRIKYEKNNPVISFRINKELFDRLQAVKTKEGKSIADILKIGVGLLEVKIRKEDECFQNGYKTARDLFAIPFPCARCGKTTFVKTLKEKEAIRKILDLGDWGHEECIKQD